MKNRRGNTEVIAVLDGDWPNPPINDHPDVTLIHHSKSIGQRAATNEAARVSQARFVMKADAHCAFDEGFDIKLMETFEHDWTVIPRMFTLHVFDWKCRDCGTLTYQGPPHCNKCGTKNVEKVVVWQPNWRKLTDFARFDRTLHFQYWQHYRRRPEAQGDIVDNMCFVGACFMMERSRYWELG